MAMMFCVRREVAHGCGALPTRSVADRLRKGKSDQATCPGVKGFTDEDLL